MTRTRERIPPHLRQFVVEQDYGVYDEIDHAVWRFVLLQMHASLEHAAHPAYAEGLASTGISLERIPSIVEMDARLAEYGWGAVAVDGFIPPRAFQEFQELGILTIAAEIRTAEHLAYTPAPDIIHESAGHAPIIPDRAYRSFLQRFGEVGSRAFSSAEDRRVYAAIHLLSELKEDPGIRPAQIEAAERELAEAQAAVSATTEAALLSRLHWWTVEYGLVGTPRDYKLYGAGLLSSLGESHFCHDPDVRKLPLSAACIEVDYDITKPQPQLFVAESFEQLSEVLDDVAAGLSQRMGGTVALERALRSDEVATIELASGVQIIGRLTSFVGAADAPALLIFGGPCALALDGRILAGQAVDRHLDGYATPIGRLASGEALSTLAPEDLPRRDPLELRFGSGVIVAGHLQDTRCDANGRLRLIELRDARISHGSNTVYRGRDGALVIAVGEAVRSAHAGPADPAYWPESEFSDKRVPHKSASSSHAHLVRLYEQARCARDACAVAEINQTLRESYPDEWLLRWNMLELLRRLDGDSELAAALRRDMLEIESRYPRDVPVSTGLRYLDRRYPAA